MIQTPGNPWPYPNMFRYWPCGYYHFYPNEVTCTGWKCPSCKRVYAPDIKECESCNKEIPE